MIRRASRIVQTVRDAILLVVSILLIGSMFRPNIQVEPASYILAGIMAFVLALSIINVILNVFKAKQKGYFLGNSIFQLIVGLFLAIGLYPPAGIILVILNVAVLATLWEKKTPEELMKHPPKPITRKYRVFVGAGVFVMFVAILLSWLNDANFPLIGIYLRTVDLTTAANLVSNAVAMLFGFLAVVAAPISIMLGLLSQLRRMFAWLSGILAVVVGIGWIVSMTTMAGPGAYVFILGGALVLAALVSTK